MQFFCCSTNLVLENQASVNHEINFIFLVRTFMYVKKERKKDVFSYFSLNLNVNDFLLMSESQVYLCLGVFDLSYIIGKHLGVNARQSFKHIFCLSFRLRQNTQSAQQCYQTFNDSITLGEGHIRKTQDQCQEKVPSTHHKSCLNQKHKARQLFD